MVALDAANTSNGLWKMLVTVKIFITSLVPFQLYSTKPSGDKFILWQNLMPSVRNCRTTWIQMKKEPTELAKEETSVVEEGINELEKTMITLEEQNGVVFVSHNMVLTMIDGKICNAISSTSQVQMCYVCGDAQKQIKCIVKLLKDVST